MLLPSDLASVMIVSKLHGEKAATEDYNSGKAAIGTGPYKFAEYVPNQRVVLKANYGYWGGEEPWDKVTFKILTNPAARVAALLSGDVQMIETVPTADIAKLGKDPKYALVGQGLQPRDLRAPEPEHREVAALRHGQVRQAPGEEPVPRRAREEGAVDRPSTATRSSTASWRRRRVAAAQLLPDFFYGTSKKLKPAKYDPEGAKKLLAEAGYPNGFALTIHGPNNRYINDDKVAQAIAQFYSRIGIDAKVETMPSAVYFTRATKLEFGYMVLGWGTESGEQGSSLRSLLATYDRDKGMGVTNRGRYSNPEFDKVLGRPRW